MGTELVATEPSALAIIMPAMSIEEAVKRRALLVAFTSKILKKNYDFGVIPGTKSKPSLFKPGAEKLTTFFGLTKKFEVTEKEEDWTGERHGGEPFFFFTYKCQLFHGPTLIAESEGSCNSWESKYRFRTADRVCPECGKAAIIKGKKEFGGGWLCWREKDGCGAKFVAGDAKIEGQQAGRKPNPDIFDQVNTLQKMGQKRALIAATLLAVNASEFFTQDVEDFAGAETDAEYEVKKSTPKPEPKSNGSHKPTDSRPFGVRALGGLTTRQADLVKRNVCKDGVLVNYILAQGQKWGWSSVIPDWQPEIEGTDGHIYNVQEMIQAWVADFITAREEAPDRQPGDDPKEEDDEIPFGQPA